MYSVKNILKQEPMAISAAIIAVLNTFVLAGLIHLTKDVVIATNTSLVLVLGLFYVRPFTTSTDALNKLGDEAAKK
jgi:hypothetical protein